MQIWIYIFSTYPCNYIFIIWHTNRQKFFIKFIFIIIIFYVNWMPVHPVCISEETVLY